MTLFYAIFYIYTIFTNKDVQKGALSDSVQFKYKHNHLRRNRKDVLTWHRYSEMNLSLLYMKLTLTVTKAQRHPTLTFSCHLKSRRTLITTIKTVVDQIIAYPMASHTSWLLINFKQTLWAKVSNNEVNAAIKPVVSGCSSDHNMVAPMRWPAP